VSDGLSPVKLCSVHIVSPSRSGGRRAPKPHGLTAVAAQLGGVVGPHYAASKAGVIGLTHSYAHLLAKEGITVNAIAPALVETEMVTGNPNGRAGLIPVGRFGTVEETADVAVMLARNGCVTGQRINVNGGWHMS
jgi:3-oxoacyl-[acyl-carrier protein] reductase